MPPEGLCECKIPVTIGNQTRELPAFSAVFTLTDQYNFGIIMRGWWTGLA
jgi:hypothetical protein